MASKPVDIVALADEIASLTKRYADKSAVPDGSSEQIQTEMHIMSKAKNLINQVQNPFFAVMEHSTNFYQICCIRALMEVGVFETIPAEGSMHVKDLAAAVKADEVLIIRMMRMLTSTGIFDEVKVHEYSHNRMSIVYSKDRVPTQHYYMALSYDEQFGPIFQLPAYLKKFGYKDVHSLTDTPYSFAHGMLGSTFWEIMNTQQEGQFYCKKDIPRHEAFDRGLSAFEALAPPVGIYPFDIELAVGNSPDRPLMVDIGGGRGQALVKVRASFPQLKGKLVLQDRPGVLDAISEHEVPEVEKQVHDFFTPQPVHGAQVYYFRRIFHDWQDDDAVRILNNIRPAMAKDSRILIAEMSVPEPVRRVDAHAVWLDLMMMGIGGRERTTIDWEQLVNGVEGLKLVKIWSRPQFGLQVVVEIRLDE